MTTPSAITHLTHILQSTYETTGPHRDAAEQQLVLVEQQPGVLPLYMQLLDDNTVNLGVKQACCLRIKNIVNDHWSMHGDTDNNRINDADRQYMKQHIYSRIGQTTVPVLKSQLLECCYVIIKFDFPEQWPTLYDTVTADLNQNTDRHRLYNAVFVLKLIFKRYQYKTEEKRAALYTIIAQLYPRLFDIATVLLNEPDSTDNYVVLQRICKIFFISVQLHLPEYLRNPDVLSKWLAMFQYILLQKHTPITPDDDNTDGELTPLEKCKKNAAQILNRMFNIYGQPKKCSKKLRPFATVFFDTYAVSLVQTFMQVLRNKSEGKSVVNPRVLHVTYIFMTSAIRYSKLWATIQPSIEWLITQSIFRTLCMTQHEIEEFNENGIEFLEVANDMAEEFYDPKIQAKCLLFDLIRLRKRHAYQLTMQYIGHIFEQYKQAPSMENAVLLESAIHVFGTVHKLLMSEAQNIPQIESIIYMYIVPQIDAHFAFLKFRAITVFGEFWRLTYDSINQQHNVNMQQILVDHLFHLLQSGKQPVPVKYAIFASISKLIHGKVYAEKIRPISSELFNHFFQFCETYTNENMIAVLDQFITCFTTEIVPYAIDIIVKLKTIFMNIVRSSSADGISDNSSMTGNQCISTITNIGFIVGENKSVDKSIFLTFEQSVMEMITVVMSTDTYIEFFDEVCELCTCLTYYTPSLSPAMYSMLTHMLTIGQTWATDYIAELCSVMDNFVSKDNTFILTNQQPNYLSALIQFGTAIIGDRTREADAQHVIVLFESLITNITLDRQQIDYKLIDYMLEVVISNVTLAKKPMNRFLLIDLFCVCVNFAPQYVCTRYNYWSDHADFFKLWFGTHSKIKASFKHLKCSILALLALVQLPNDQLAIPLRNTQNQLLNGVMKLLGDIKNVENERTTVGQADEEDLDADDSEDEEADDDNIDEDDEDDYDNAYFGRAVFVDLEDTADADSSDDDDGQLSDVEDMAADGKAVDLDGKIDLRALAAQAADGVGDDFEDDDDAEGDDRYEADYDDWDEGEYLSPLDKVDEFVTFAATVKMLEQQHPHIYSQWIRSISKGNAKKLKTYLVNAAKRQKEINDKAAAEQHTQQNAKPIQMIHMNGHTR